MYLNEVLNLKRDNLAVVPAALELVVLVHLSNTEHSLSLPMR